ncbi:histone-lysine N-methyltransferase SETD1B [Salmo trutta]|uniref:histone-lysine N-methyltransferase SETD1B n=1 Tax=Salmo trutta TaxID=8032 RepID=UPI00112FFF0A|nr:histone-lysine N-methyltransferase SETD1B-like [Salmo trutta]
MAVSFFGKVITPFLAYFLVEVTGEQQYGGLGGKITLTPKVSGQPEDILWKHTGNKVVEFDGSQNVEYGRYKGRTILDWSSGALTIKGLADADSGPYELEAVVKGKLQYSQHEVDVIDDVAQPSVTCVVDNTTPENMDRTLLCSADLQPLTQFIWRSPGGSESPGPELFIPVGENQESVYTCVVKNPVSEKTAEFTLKDCYTKEGSTSVLAVVLSILLLLVLVAVLAFLWWHCRKCTTILCPMTKSDQKANAAEAALRTSEEEGLMDGTVQGNKDPEDDHSENTGNMYSTQKGMVKKQVELLNMQDTDANRKQHTTPAGRIFSPTKSGGHRPLYRQNDSLSDQQTVTDTEPVQDKPNPAQPKLVTPESKEAQLGTDTPEPNQETAPEREMDSAGTTETGQTDSVATAGSVMDNQTEDGEEEKKDNQTRDGEEKEKKDNQTGDGEEEDNQTGHGEEEDNQTGHGEEDNQTGHGEEEDNQTGHGEEEDNQTGHGEEEDNQTGHREEEDNQTGHGEEEDNQTGHGEEEDNQTGHGEKKDNQTGHGEEKKDHQTRDGEEKEKKDNQTRDGEEKEKDNQTGDGEEEKKDCRHTPYSGPTQPDPNSHESQNPQRELEKEAALQPSATPEETQGPTPPPPDHSQAQSPTPPPPDHSPAQSPLPPPPDHSQDQSPTPPPPDHSQDQSPTPPPPDHSQAQSPTPPPPDHSPAQSPTPPPPDHSQAQSPTPPPPDHSQAQSPTPPPPDHSQAQSPTQIIARLRALHRS